MPRSVDEEILQGARNRAREAVRFFSNAGKAERETWVVRTFLRNFKIPFSEGDFRTDQDEPVDVAFRSARFQVKEITDQRRERQREYREKLDRLERTKRLADLPPRTYRLTPVDIRDVARRVATNASELVCGPGRHAGYAPNAIRDVDLVFYVNFLDSHITGSLLRPVGLSREARMWRSISFMSDTLSAVLWAEHTAPEILVEREGRVAYWYLEDL